MHMKAAMLGNQMISRGFKKNMAWLTCILPVVLLLQSKYKIAVFYPTKLQIKLNNRIWKTFCKLLKQPGSILKSLTIVCVFNVLLLNEVN